MLPAARAAMDGRQMVNEFRKDTDNPATGCGTFKNEKIVVNLRCPESEVCVG